MNLLYFIVAYVFINAGLGIKLKLFSMKQPFTPIPKVQSNCHIYWLAESFNVVECDNRCVLGQVLFFVVVIVHFLVEFHSNAVVLI